MSSHCELYAASKGSLSVTARITERSPSAGGEFVMLDREY
jgi:hypothetical protein